MTLLAVPTKAMNIIKLSLQSLANQVAMTARKAQVFALGVRSNQASGGAVVRGYGVHFQTNAIGAKSFVFFADLATATTADNRQFNGSPNGPCSDTPIFGEECIQRLTITTGDEISKICLEDTAHCVYPGGGLGAGVGGGSSFFVSNFDSIDAVFTRPNTSATIQAFSGSTPVSVCSGGIFCKRLIVVLRSPRDKCKEITMNNNGQIGVADGVCQ